MLQVPYSEYLQKNELRDLTGAARSAAQLRWLEAQGIWHRVDGRRVIVSRVHVREWLEGKEHHPARMWEPDFSGPGFVDSGTRKPWKPKRGPF